MPIFLATFCLFVCLFVCVCVLDISVRKSKVSGTVVRKRSILSPFVVTSYLAPLSPLHVYRKVPVYVVELFFFVDCSGSPRTNHCHKVFTAVRYELIQMFARAVKRNLVLSFNSTVLQFRCISVMFQWARLLCDRVSNAYFAKGSRRRIRSSAINYPELSSVLIKYCRPVGIFFLNNIQYSLAGRESRQMEIQCRRGGMWGGEISIKVIHWKPCSVHGRYCSVVRVSPYDYRMLQQQHRSASHEYCSLPKHLIFQLILR